MSLIGTQIGNAASGGGGGGGVSGSGTADTLAKFTGASAVGDSSVTDDGTDVTFGNSGDVIATTPGRLLLGSTGVVGLGGAGGTAYSISRVGSDFEFNSNSNVAWEMRNGTGICIRNDHQFAFSSTTIATGALDVGVSRSAAGILTVTDGSSGFGDLALTANAATNTPLSITAAPSQTANLAEFFDNTPTLKGAVNEAGEFEVYNTSGSLVYTMQAFAPGNTGLTIAFASGSNINYDSDVGGRGPELDCGQSLTILGKRRREDDGDYTQLTSDNTTPNLGSEGFYGGWNGDANRIVQGVQQSSSHPANSGVWEHRWFNRGAFNLTFTHEDTGEANGYRRFHNPAEADVILAPDEMVFAPVYNSQIAGGRRRFMIKPMLSTASIAPAQITANQNDYDPGGRARVIRLNTDASRNVTGLTFNSDPYDGEEHFIINDGSNDLVLTDEDTNSTAAYRFANVTNASITLAAGEMALLIYDGGASRWRVAEL